ncbi:hypothetical protein Hanom_Chr08g00703571 [Helianthus anomalus]
MKPTNETIKIMNPMMRSGVWRMLSQVALLLVIHKAPPIMGMDASSVNRFSKPITVLLNLDMFGFLSSCVSIYMYTLSIYILSLSKVCDDKCCVLVLKR